MKALFLSYNQALTDRVNDIFNDQGIRGFTRWALTEGRGSVDGEPHYGTHAWPSMNASILAIVEDAQVDIPQCMIEEQIDYQLKEMEYSMMYQGFDLKTYLSYTGMTMDRRNLTFEQ